MGKRKMLKAVLNGRTVAEVCECGSAADRLRGLIGCDEGTGALLRVPEKRQKAPGWVNSVHMLGMKRPLALFWLSPSGLILEKALAEPGLHVYGTAYSPVGAVLELDAAAWRTLRVGDMVVFEDAE